MHNMYSHTRFMHNTCARISFKYIIHGCFAWTVQNVSRSKHLRRHNSQLIQSIGRRPGAHSTHVYTCMHTCSALCTARLCNRHLSLSIHLRSFWEMWVTLRPLWDRFGIMLLSCQDTLRSFWHRFGIVHECTDCPLGDQRFRVYCLGLCIYIYIYIYLCTYVCAFP